MTSLTIVRSLAGIALLIVGADHLGRGASRLALAGRIGRLDGALLFTGHVNARWEGGLFLFFYAAFTAVLVMKATSSDALRALQGGMVWFVLPLTVVTLGAQTFLALRHERAPAA
jgi:hypothetical protein